MRCKECHATIPTPDDRRALTTKCQYCGLEQPVPDAEERRKHLLAEEREAAHARVLEQREATRLAEIAQREKEHAWEREKDALEQKAKREDRRSARWSRRFSILVGLLGALIAPVIIAITVFDAPARLGFGASGKDRLEQIQTQLSSTGCTTLHAPDAEYATGPVSKLVGMSEGDCIRVFAASGDATRQLGVRVFGPTNAELAKQAATVDPQLLYCSQTAQTVRFQVDNPWKGRLSHMVLKCPAPPPPKPKQRPHSH